MRICDFCWSTTGQPTPATTQVTFGPTELPTEVYDVCEGCVATIKLVINTPKDKRPAGRPRKNLTDRQGDGIQ